jgi:decaprenylphospho-beta-D-erythro-pentofuranosid-2-ulose 2-reductase
MKPLTTSDAARRSVILCGATSAVGQALGRRLAARGWAMHLLGRDLERLERIAADLTVRAGAAVSYSRFDATDLDAIPTVFSDAVSALGNHVDGLIVCHGLLCDEADRLPSADAIRATIDVNFASVAILLSLAADVLVARNSGFLVALSSVAGDRGRQSNFCYGAAKAGLTAWLSGLRNRLYPTGVRVLTVKPGIIASPMTAGLAVGPKALITNPDRVARDIEHAILCDRDVIYTPWFWQPIMAIICLIPESVFKRLRL